MKYFKVRRIQTNSNLDILLSRVNAIADQMAKNGLNQKSQPSKGQLHIAVTHFSLDAERTAVRWEGQFQVPCCKLQCAKKAKKETSSHA